MSAGELQGASDYDRLGVTPTPDDERLEPVIERLTDEHLVIHDAIEEVDRALVHHMTEHDFGRLQGALDVLTDTLLSHLSYEEHELVEPLARLGFYANQIRI